MSRKNWKYFAIILLTLNLLLIFKNYDKTNIREINPEVSYTTDYESFPIFVESEYLKELEKDINVFIFFNEDGCIDCISYEVEKLNELQNKYKEYLNTYLIGKDETYLSRLFGAQFEYKRIPNVDFSNLNLNTIEPFILVVDKNGVVQLVYFAERNNYGKTDSFYSKLESLLEVMEN